MDTHSTAGRGAAQRTELRGALGALALLALVLMVGTPPACVKTAECDETSACENTSDVCYDYKCVSRCDADTDCGASEYCASCQRTTDSIDWCPGDEGKGCVDESLAYRYGR